LYEFILNSKTFNNLFVDYISYSEDPRHNKPTNYKRFPGIMPAWDNSSRRKNGNAIVFLNSTPQVYLNWLRSLIKKFVPFSEEENFIFINAWNEWAEGAHLEPCQRWGKAYLDATKSAFKDL
jgi:hypothetical protein